MKSIDGTSATHNVCPAECQNSNDKVVLTKLFSKGEGSVGQACATSIVLSIRPDALEHLTPSLTLYSDLNLILCLCLNLCLCLDCVGICIWIALSICPVALEHHTPSLPL